jgi:hypothetical protein
MSADPTSSGATESTEAGTMTTEADCGRRECEVRCELGRFAKKLDQLLEWLNGNGQVGIKTRLALLEAQVAAMRWLMKVLIGSVITLFMSVMGGVILLYFTRGG